MRFWCVSASPAALAQTTSRHKLVYPLYILHSFTHTFLLKASDISQHSDWNSHKIQPSPVTSGGYIF